MFFTYTVKHSRIQTSSFYLTLKTHTLGLCAPLYLADTGGGVCNKGTEYACDIQLGRLIITGNALYIYIESIGNLLMCSAHEFDIFNEVVAAQ